MADDIKRLNYFNGQFLREQDFSDEQTYHLQQQRDHARLLHTPGIANGLEVPDPAAGASSVTVQAGVAYDDQGRRIVLADNEPVDLSGFASGQPVYITITYTEELSEVSNETGISGSTRMTEVPLIETSLTAPGNPNQKLLLAKVNRTGTVVGTIDRSQRLQAGAKGGNLSAYSLTLTSDTVAPSGWAKMQLTTSRQAVLDSSLQVTGTITGAIGAGLVDTAQLVDSAVTTAKLANAAVTGAKIANLTVATGNLADASVTGAKIANLTVGTGNLADLSVTGAKIAALSVNTGQLIDNAVTTLKIVDNAVTTAKIVDNAVTTAKIADGAVTAAKIADLNVNTADLTDLAVTTAKLANAAVTGAKIANLTVATGNLADASVTGAKIANLTVATGNLVDAAVTGVKIAGLTVSTGHLVDSSVTGAKLAGGSVATGHIVDGAVTGLKLANGAVGTPQIVDGAVTLAKMAGGAVGTTQLVDSSVPIQKLKLSYTYNASGTIAAGGTSTWGFLLSPDPDGIWLVTAYPTSANGNITWTTEYYSDSSSNPYAYYIVFKNNSSSTAVSFTFKLKRLSTT